LGKAGHALEKAVAAGQHADEQPLDHAVLTDDDALDLEERLLELGRRAGDVWELVGRHPIQQLSAAGAVEERARSCMWRLLPCPRHRAVTGAARARRFGRPTVTRTLAAGTMRVKGGPEESGPRRSGSWRVSQESV